MPVDSPALTTEKAALVMLVELGINQLQRWEMAWKGMAVSAEGELSDMATKTARLFADVARIGEEHVARWTARLSDIDVGEAAKKPSTLARLFVLNRLRDPGGVSGTGCVAEGMVASNGQVVVFWKVSPFGVTHWSSVGDMMYVHGHGTDTRLEWVTPDEGNDDERRDAEWGR